jgi:hypothetical protein
MLRQAVAAAVLHVHTNITIFSNLLPVLLVFASQQLL